MRKRILAAAWLLSASWLVYAENTDLALEQKDDDVLVAILNNSSSRSVPVNNSSVTHLKLYSMDGFGSCPYPLSEKVEGRGCSTQYYLALSIGELGPSQYVYFLGDVGEITELKAISVQSMGVELSFNVHDYAPWVYKDFQQEFPTKLKDVKNDIIAKKVFIGEGGIKEIK